MLGLCARRAAAAARAASLHRGLPAASAALHASGPTRAEEEVDLSKAQARAVGNPKVEALVAQITALNMLEVADLVEILRVKLGLPANAGGMMMMGGGAPAAAPAAAAPAAEAAPVAAPAKADFDVKLESFDAASKIKIIKEVRAATGLGLKEAKDLVRDAKGAPPGPAQPHGFGWAGCVRVEADLSGSAGGKRAHSD